MSNTFVVTVPAGVVTKGTLNCGASRGDLEEFLANVQEVDRQMKAAILRHYIDAGLLEEEPEGFFGDYCLASNHRPRLGRLALSLRALIDRPYPGNRIRAQKAWDDCRKWGLVFKAGHPAAGRDSEDGRGIPA